jgi:hypothetical protein
MTKQVVLSPVAQSKLEEAQKLLSHYFELSSRGEWSWDHDNMIEIELIVSHIFEAAVIEAVARVDQHYSRP